VRVAIYCRVSTDEQRKHGYSIADQKRTLTEHAERCGMEVVGPPLVDEGISADNLTRPGLREIYRLAEAGEIDAAIATYRDRYFRKQLYRLIADEDLEEHGVSLIALNDTGNRIGDGAQDAVSEDEKLRFVKRSRAGKRERARQGKVIPSGNNLPYGFDYNADRSNYVPNPAEMEVVRRMFGMMATGSSLKGVCKTLDSESVPTPGNSTYWNPITVRRLLLKDLYLPHTADELLKVGVADEVVQDLDPDQGYGVWWFGETRIGSSGRRKKRDDTIPVPVPLGDAIPREWVEATRRYFNTYRGWRDKDGAHFYELRGMVYCGSCGRKMTGAHNNGYYYYSCVARRNHGKRACPESKNYRADGRTGAEHIIRLRVESLLQDPERVRQQLDQAIAAETASIRNPYTEAETWMKRVQDCERKRSGYLDLAADGLMSKDQLRQKLSVLDENQRTAERHLKDAKDGQTKLEDLKRTKRTILASYADGILYDGLMHFAPEMRRQIYDALGLRVTVETDPQDPKRAMLTVDYRVDANVLRLTKVVEQYAADEDKSRHLLTVGGVNPSNTAMSIVVMKWSEET